MKNTTATPRLTKISLVNSSTFKTGGPGTGVLGGLNKPFMANKG